MRENSSLAAAIFLPRVISLARCWPGLHFETREQLDITGLSTRFDQQPTMVLLAGIIAAPILTQCIFCPLFILKTCLHVLICQLAHLFTNATAFNLELGEGVSGKQCLSGR